LLSDTNGSNAYWCKHSIAGAQLGIEEFNKRHPDRTCALLVEEHGMDTAKAVTAVQTLLHAGQVDAVYSEFSSISSAVATPIQAARRMFIYSAGATSIVRTNPYAFRTLPEFEAGCRAVAEQWKRDGLTRPGILKFNGEPGELCSIGVRHIFPDAREEVYDRASDVSVQVMRLHSNRAQSILNIGYEGDLDNMMRAVERLKWKVRIFTFGPSLTPILRAQHPETTEGAVIYDLKAPPASFLEMVHKRFPKGGFTSTTPLVLPFIHIQQLADAITSCPKGDLECQRKKIEQSPAQPEFGFLGWGNDHIALLSVGLRTVRSGTE